MRSLVEWGFRFLLGLREPMREIVFLGSECREESLGSVLECLGCKLGPRVGIGV